MDVSPWAGWRPIAMFAVAHCCLPKKLGIVGPMDLGRFGRIVYARRSELGLTQEEVARNGGPTDTTLGKIENAEWTPGNRKTTLRKLDVGLQWTEGSAMRALEGGEPTPLPRQNTLPPLSEVKPFRGTNSVRWRMIITQKPESERTEEETAWLAANDAERDRLSELAQRQGVGSFDDVVEDDSWIPEGVPASRQPRWSSFQSRTFEEIFNEWQVTRAKLLNLELEYAIGRKIDPEDAAAELADVLQMITDNRNGSGRPWTPPWDPGADFLPGEEPWKAEFWSTRRVVDGIFRLGVTYDLQELRARRAETAQADAAWEEDKRRQTEAYFSDIEGRAATHDVPSASPSPSGTSSVTAPAQEMAGRHSAAEGALHRLLGGTQPSTVHVDFAIPAIDIVVSGDADLLPRLEAARIDHAVVEAQHATTTDLIDAVTALSSLTNGDDVDTAVAVLFLAVERYVAATDETIDAMQRVDLYATPQQIDVAIKAFDFFTTASETFVPLLDDIAAKAPTVVLRKPAVLRGDLLRDLVRRLQRDKAAWIESGLSANHPPSAQRHLIAARTAPKGYQPGKSVQGEASGEESQDPGGDE